MIHLSLSAVKWGNASSGLARGGAQLRRGAGCRGNTGIPGPLQHLRAASRAQDGWAATRLCTEANNCCTTGVLLLCCLFSRLIAQRSRGWMITTCVTISQETSTAFRFVFVLMFLNTVLSILPKQRTTTQGGRSPQRCSGSSQKVSAKIAFL